MSSISRTWIVNGEQRAVRFVANARLLDVLREELGLLSLKEGCGEGECGACSILLDDELHLACLVAAAQVEEGSTILSAEGLAASELGRRLQEAFLREGAVQCGYCTPGMLLASVALLRANLQPTEEEIRGALAGNLCRCTGYASIVKAVQAAARGGKS